MPWDHPATLAAFGALVGFVGALVGVGGGFLLVPYFALVLRWHHLQAAATSLGIVLVNAASAALGYARQRRVDWLVGAVFAVATIPGTVAGNLAADRITGGAFKVAFAAVAAVAAVYLVAMRPGATVGPAWLRRGRRREIVDAFGERHAYELNLWVGALASVPVGFLAALFGVGGGFLHVPMLVLLYGAPLHVATATSTFILVVTAAAGEVQYAHRLEEPSVLALLYGGVGAFFGAQIGTLAAPRVQARALRWVLALVLVTAGGFMAWRGLAAP